MSPTAPVSPGKAAADRPKKRKTPKPSSDAILDSAEAVFAERGFANTSLRQLLAAARVSTTAFYARFDSRDAVLEALVHRFLEELAGAAAQQLGSVRGVEEGFGKGIEVLLALVSERKELIGVLLGEAAGSEAARDALAVAYGQLAGLLSANLERLVQRGELEAQDARTIGWALVGAVKIQLERWAVLDDLDDAELAEALTSTARALLPLVKGRRS